MFFYDTKELEQWMAHSQEILASMMDKKDLSQMEAQQLLQEVMKMKQRLEEQQLVLRDLQQRSKHIVHLKKRRQRLTEPIPIFAVCDYPGIDLNVVKGQEYALLDNANRTKWRVVNRAGMEGNVPGVCFMIPPPNSEAIDNALQLEAHFKHLVEMWSTTQTRLQQWIQTLSQRQSTQSIDSVGRTTVQQTEQVPQQQQQIVQRIQNGQELQTRSTSARRTVTSRKETTEDGQTLITEEITEQMPDGETHRTVTTKKIRTQEVFPTGEAPQVPLERMAAPEIQTHRTVTLKQQTLGHEARPPQVVPPDRSGTFPQSRRHAMLQQFQENTEQMRFEEERRRREQQQQAAEMDLERRMIEEEHRRRERLEIERREEIRMMQEQMEAERQQVERIRLERHQQAEQAERQQAERIAYEQQQAEQLALERQREEERRLVEEMARERLDFEMTVAQQAEQLERESAEHIGAKRRKMDEMAQLVAKQRLGEQITATGMQYERTIAQQAAVAAQERQQRQAQQPRQPEVVESITPRQVRTPTPRIESQQHSLEDITGQLRSSQQDLRHKSLRRSETDLMQQDALETDQQQLQLQVTRNQYITSEQVSTQYTERRDDQRHVTTEQQRPVVDAAASRMGQVELVAQELAREVESCNRLIDEMSSTSQASISSEDRQVVESVSLDMDSFLRRLYKDEERLQSRVETPLPHTMEESRVLHDDFQTFHNDLAELQPVYDRISDVAAHILQEREGQFPKLAEKYHILNEKWDSLVRHSNACSERVALVTDIVHTLHRAREVITSCEKVLTLHGKMPGEMDKHQDHLDKIQGLQKTLPPFQPVVDKLNDEMVRVGSLSKTTPTHQDVQRLESEVHSILGRWKDVCNQTHERLKRLTQSGDLLQEFNDLLTRESNWISQAEVTLMEFEHVAKGSLNLVQQLGAAREFNKQVAGRQHYMMETNGRGEAFIGQAQSYDSTVEAYKTKVQGSHPRSLAKRETHRPGAQLVREDLQQLNKRYRELVARVNLRVDTIHSAGNFENDPEAALDADQTVRPVPSADLSSALMSKVKQLGDREPEDGQVVSTEAEPTKKDANPGKLEEPLVNPDKPGNPHPRSGNPHPANPQPGNPHPGNPKSTSGKSHENPDPNLGNPNPKPGNPHPENPGRDNPKERNPRPGVGNPHPDNPKPHNPKDQGEGSEIPGDSITTRTEYTVTSTTRRFAPFPKGQEVEVYPKAETEKQPHSQTSSSAASDPYRTASWRPLGEGPPSRGEVGPPGFAFQTFTKSGEASPLSYKPPPIASPELVMWRVKRLLSAEVPVSYLSPSEKRLTTFFAPDTSASPSDSVLTWVS